MRKKKNRAVRYYVYMAECSDGTYYTGITTDLKRRMKEHNSGAGARYTAGRTPVKCVYFEKRRGRPSASKREYRIKKLSRSEKSLLAGSAPG